MKNFFELNKPYRFEINDIIALIYCACAVIGMMGINATPLFLIGSAIGFATCFSAHRINLVALNGALFALNLFNALKYLF